MTSKEVQRADPRVAAFLDAFAARRYFEAHEILEGWWLEYREDDRDFFQGLIQAAVALHHAAHGNREGARGVARSCRGRMTPFAPRHHGIEVAAFLDALDEAVEGRGAPPSLASLSRDRRGGRPPRRTPRR